MNYFEGITEVEKLKDRYKQLSKKHHPDLGGCLETMKAINAQYDTKVKELLKDTKSASEIEEFLADNKELLAKIYDLAAIPGIAVEICGVWIWVTGDTKPVKETLKASGFLWSTKKTAWYWRKEAKFSPRWSKGGEWDLERIRDHHGRTDVRSGQRTARKFALA